MSTGAMILNRLIAGCFILSIRLEINLLNRKGLKEYRAQDGRTMG
jgi:hypothetical protein